MSCYGDKIVPFFFRGFKQFQLTFSQRTTLNVLLLLAWGSKSQNRAEKLLGGTRMLRDCSLTTEQFRLCLDMFRYN